MVLEKALRDSLVLEEKEEGFVIRCGLPAGPCWAARLNPKALEFVSCRSESDAGSPAGCSSPSGSEGRPQDTPRLMCDQQENAAVNELQELGSSGQQSDVIPAPTPRAAAPSRQRSGSLPGSRSASPPPPALPHPGLMPTYGWGAPIPVYHVYPPPHMPPEGPIERAASPPGVFPAGSSPPLPTGFISVPLRPMPDPGSPTSQHMYGSSPPVAGSPPAAMMYMPPPPPPMMHSSEFGMAHAGYAMQQQQEFVHRMANMSLMHPQPVASAPVPQRTGSIGSSSSAGGGAGGRSEGRASARIARSHRAGGAYNPQEFAFSLEEATSGRPDARRTLMVRNIPNKYTQEMMLSVLHKSGFSGTFDFFYLPIDFRNKCNLGYCFLNFLEAGSAARLYREWHNKRWEEHNSKKVCEVTYARVQGQETLVQHFRASKFPSDDAEFMPLVYTKVEEGVASDPVPIHKYLDSSSSSSDAGGSREPAAGEDAAAAADAP